MGLDIAFDRKKAIAAGLEIKVIPNDGTYDEGDDPDYIEWCKGSEECIKVPHTSHYIINDGNDEHIVVRANKWGGSYYPLTTWLTWANITWTEF